MRIESVEIVLLDGMYPRSHSRTFALRFRGWACGCDASVSREQLSYDLTFSI